jgi:signal transduction histidine kinase
MRRGGSIPAFAAGMIVVAVGFFGFKNLGSRPGLGISDAASDPSVRIIRIDEWEIRGVSDIDFVLSRKRIGDPVEVGIEKGGRTMVAKTVLVPYYSRTRFPLIFALTGIFGFLIGFLVLALRPGDERARVFYAMTLAFSSSVLISGDLYGVHDRGLSLIPGILFNFAYPFAPALLWYFAGTFVPGSKRFRRLASLGIPIMIGVLFNLGFLTSQLRPSIAAFRSTEAGFVFFRWYVAVLSVLAAVALARAYRAVPSREVRAQIKWVFSGICGGLFLYVFFYQIPMAVGGAPWLSEDLTSAFFILMPLTMAVAVLKFRLMDIDVVINRSIVYSILTVTTAGVYFLCLEVLGRLLSGTGAPGPIWVSLPGVVLAAASFEPVRKRVQLAVDRTFFRQAYDHRKAVLSFSVLAGEAPSPELLEAGFTEAVMSALPLEKIGVLVAVPGAGGPKIAAAQGMDLLSEPSSDRIWARPEAVRTGEGMDFTRPDLLDKTGFDIILPLPAAAGNPRGHIGLGRKKSGGRFTAEDIDLVSALGAELVSGLRRIRLQAEVAYERASREKADELVRLKTEFVSSVSHELRTPMSSIRNLAELLESGKVPDREKRERLLGLMAGECGRLSRFIGNVLDFGKIEQDSRTYDPRPVTVQPVVADIIEVARSVRGGTALEAEMPAEPVVITVDPDAFRQALGNLVDNALAYGGGRDVTIRVADGANDTVIQVEDKGIGIDPEEREKIFEAFFRSSRGAAVNPRGTGLGLKIVRHIMDAHGGRVELKSEPGRGSVFSLVFPKGGENEKDIDRR